MLRSSGFVTLRRLVQTCGQRTKFTLPELAYGYGELEPVISGEIMEIHHTK